MKKIGLILVLSTLFTMNAFAARTFQGVVTHENISGSCDTVYNRNEVIKAMIALAKASAKSSADFRFLYFNGAVQVSEFKINCVQTGMKATVTAEAEFEGKRQN